MSVVMRLTVLMVGMIAGGVIVVVVAVVVMGMVLRVIVAVPFQPRARLLRQNQPGSRPSPLAIADTLPLGTVGYEPEC